MEALIQAFWRILLLRAGPQTVPAAPGLMWLALVLHYGVGLSYALLIMPFAQAVIYALVSTLAMVAVVHGLLLLFGKRARYMQCLTALASCESMLGLLLLPLGLLIHLGGMGEELRALWVILSLVAVGWNVALAAHIFRHSLDVSRGLGFLYGIAYLIIAMTLGDMAGVAGGA